MRTELRGFTFIELLVVVTIIAVLIAILAPALDRAIYQAELAACGATIKGLVQGGLMYAMDHNRRYPSRHPAYQGEHDPTIIKYPHKSGSALSYDLTASMRKYIGIDSFLDPLCGGVDLEVGSERPDPPILGSNYRVYYDWGIAPMGQRFRRIGDRMAFGPYTPPEDQRLRGGEVVTEVREFRVVVADEDSRHTQPSVTRGPVLWSGHADDEGRTRYIKLQDEGAPSELGGGPPVPGTSTMLSGSVWAGFSPPNPIDRMRGLCDYNYGLDDASIMRLTAVEQDDPRLAKLPVYKGTYGFDFKAQLPKAN